MEECNPSLAPLVAQDFDQNGARHLFPLYKPAQSLNKHSVGTACRHAPPLHLGSEKSSAVHAALPWRGE
jgi:hypothetical protein